MLFKEYPPGLVVLETSGADSSGLTEAMLEISGSIDVRLSEQHASCVGVVVDVGSLSARDDAGRQTVSPSTWRREVSPANAPSGIKNLSPSTCYPEARRRALVSLSGEGPAPLVFEDYQA
jgi:hypothetical protein